MLPPFIIEQIRQREEKERERRDSGRNQPRLEIPVDDFPVELPRERDEDRDDVNRGVLILEL
jgi:hypothetical protein